MHDYTHIHVHTCTQKDSLSHTGPTCQIRAPFILQYIQLLCDSPRQRAAILLKAIVNHLWQRERAKDVDLHIHTSLVRTVGRVEFLCTTWQWWIQFFSSQRSATGIYDAWSQCIFSPRNTRHSFCLLALSLFLYVQTHSQTNIHQHTCPQFPRDTSHPAVFESLFHLISSNRQRCGSGAGW